MGDRDYIYPHPGWLVIYGGRRGGSIVNAIISALTVIHVWTTRDGKTWPVMNYNFC